MRSSKTKKERGRAVAAQPATPVVSGGVPVVSGALALPSPTRLHNLRAVKRDFTKIYRAARNGLVDSSELGRWAFASGQLATLTEKADIEPQIAELRAQLKRLTELIEQRG